MRKLLLSALLSTQVFAFSIQTEPPINISGFVCNCGFDACDCKQGDISLSLNLNTPKRKDWLTYARCIQWMGEINCACSQLCVDMIANVSSVRLPYISADTTQTAVKQASSAVRKTATWTEKIALTIKDLTGGEDGLIARFIPFISGDKKEDGTGYTSEDVLSIVKEKSLQYSKSQSENVRNDLTMYLLTQMARNFYGKPKEERILPSEYAALINNVFTPLNREGKLGDFIALYLALKQAKDHKAKDVAYLMAQVMPSETSEAYQKAFQRKIDLYGREGIRYVVKKDKNGGVKVFLYLPEAEELLKDLPLEVKLGLISSMFIDTARSLGRKELPYAEVSSVWKAGNGLVSSYIVPTENKPVSNYTLIVDTIISKPEKGGQIVNIPVVGIPQQNSEKTAQVVRAFKEAKVSGDESSIPLWLWLIPLVPIGYYIAKKKGWLNKNKKEVKS